jgi:hypothetical protein
MIPTFILWVALQGIPIAPQVGGTVSGVLKNGEGKPAVGVRVSARTQEDSLAAIALASLAETDEEGRYTIENIPPGQYYIVAGSIDRPTYYPGTQERAGARIIQVIAGSRISGFDFTVSDLSRRAAMTLTGGASRLQINLRISPETGDRLPVTSASGPLTLQLERVTDHVTLNAPIGVTLIQLEFPVSVTDYRVNVANLPEGFVVKAITFGGVAVASGILKLSPATSGGALEITIGRVPAATTPSGRGVRVTGINRRSDSHPVYLSGRPGTVFNDGTFEFLNVPPGRHVIASIDFPGRARGATLFVGDRDIDDVELDDIAALPVDIQSPLASGPFGTASPGTKVAPVILRGFVTDRATGQPPGSGQVFISGRRGPSYHLDADGKFEISGLIPGTYKLEVQVAGYPDVIRELNADIEDILLEIQIAK